MTQSDSCAHAGPRRPDPQHGGVGQGAGLPQADLPHPAAELREESDEGARHTDARAEWQDADVPGQDAGGAARAQSAVPQSETAAAGQWAGSIFC